MSAETNKDLVKKVNASFINNDQESFIACCAEDVKWHMNTHTVAGKDGIRNILKENTAMCMEITVTDMIADESGAVCHGITYMQNTKGEKMSALYCDVYRIENNMINELSSYIVDIKKPRETETRSSENSAI